MAGRRWLLGIILGGAAALLAARGLAAIYTDYLWYAALGAAEVWRAKFTSLVVLRGGCTVAATLFVFANLYAVRQSVVSLVLPRRLGNLDIGEEVPREQLTYAAAAASVVAGVLLAWSRGDWVTVLAARAGLPFGESDPYFANDLAFFVHWLPLEFSLFNWSLIVVLSAIALVVLLYALTPSLRWEQGSLYVSGYVRRHLAMLAGALLLMLSWHYRLQMYSVLGAGSGADGLFSWLDHRVGIPASLLLFVVTLGAGLTVLWAGWTGQMRLAFAAVSGVLVAALAAHQVAPFVARRVVTERDPAVRERPYVATQAGYTRRAFAVDRVTAADATLRFTSLRQAAPFVSLWDDGALQRAGDGDRPGAVAGWQASDSTLVAAIPARDDRSEPTVFLAAAADERGEPLRVPRPQTATGHPRIVIVADSVSRPTIVSDTASRPAAPALSRGVTRFAYALALQDVRIWLSSSTPRESRIVARRTVRERLAALAPFLAQGTAVTPLWIGDTLSWAVEMYSTSRTYPLSRRITLTGQEWAYFQYAATAIVNAATGRVVLVADSVPDAIAATWLARFPRLFVRATALRAGVREQLPPARDGARAQAVAFGRFGARGGDPDAPRHLPDDEGPDSALAQTPAPLMAFPQARATAFVLPLLDRSERVRGLVIALGGLGRRTAWLPAVEPMTHWNEALDRLRASDTVTVPSLVRGYVRPLPVGERTILVQPRYDWSGVGVPHLRYVAAAAGDTVRTARSLALLGGPAPASAPPLSAAAFRARVRELYDEMRRASAVGDWGRYGRAFDALGTLLRRARP